MYADRLKPGFHHRPGDNDGKESGTDEKISQSAEEIRAETERIWTETERLKEELRRLERENAVYSSNKWRLEPEKKYQKKKAKGSQEKK